MGSMTPTPLPEGATILTADDLAHILVTGNHPEVALGGPQLDADLIDAVRAGLIHAARLADGRIVFTRR